MAWWLIAQATSGLRQTSKATLGSSIREQAKSPNTLARQGCGRRAYARVRPGRTFFNSAPIPSGGDVVRNVVATPDGKLYLACSSISKSGIAEILHWSRVSYYWLREQTWLHQKRSLTPAPSELSVVMSHWPQPKLSRTSPTQRPSSGPDPRENSGVEIHHTYCRLR